MTVIHKQRLGHLRKRMRFVLGVILGLTAAYHGSAIAAKRIDTSQTKGTATKFGFTPFPYDNTAEAVAKTQSIIEQASNLSAFHFDNCIPWSELTGDAPVPSHLREEWKRLASTVPTGNSVYVGLGVLATDRRNVAPACGSRKGEFGKMPRALRDGRLDNPELEKAYLKYVQQMVETFHPHFLNIGIEVDGLAAHAPDRWQQYQHLYDYVRTAIKRSYPNIQIGVSFGLQTLLAPAAAQAAKPLVDKSDYLGLSFYPYASSMHEKFHAPSLGHGADRWRKPLAWLRSYTNKPIAICETGFTTQNIHIRKYDLRMEGNDADQAAYVRELVRTAKQDNYLFVVWFLAIDYDQLYAKMPENSEREVNLLWRNVGMFDGKLKPKPAWAEWKQAISGLKSDGVETPPVAPPPVVSPPVAVPPPVAQRTDGITLGFSETKELFVCAPPGDVTLAKEGPTAGLASMRWRFSYKRNWQWCVKEVDRGRLKGTGALDLWVRSDRAGPLFLTLEEQNGESFYSLLQLDTQWRQVSLSLSSLSLDKAKKKDGRLDPSQITKLTIADPAGNDGASGNRVVEMAGIVFH